jgi:hypothetical protein
VEPIKNFTHRLARGEAFLQAKCRLIDTRKLSIHIKFTRARGCDLTGYYRWDDRRIVMAVKPGLRFPLKAAYSVAHAPSKDGRSKLGRQKIWYEERFDSLDDLLVFVAGHEIWHFLCDSRQRPADLDQEDLANRVGFLWLAEFKRWRGEGARVASIPMNPPRPDLMRASATPGHRSRRTAAQRTKQKAAGTARSARGSARHKRPQRTSTRSSRG